VPTVGFHASHEQLPPSRPIAAVKSAEAAGFQAAMCSDPAQHVKWLRELADLNVDALYLHHVGKEQDRFIDVFGEQVLPEVIE
jgi:hypothetical protein